MTDKKAQSQKRLDDIVARAKRDVEERGHSYRGQALKMYPWICGRCAREFNNSNLQELTVHHKNHDHDYNPEDGSNWELLCIYCHDNEHARLVDSEGMQGGDSGGVSKQDATHRPFADLGELLKKKR